MSAEALPSVTCVVTAYNHERFVLAAVQSALSQQYPPELIDVVVVNDGSTDSTRSVIERRFGDHPRVRLIDQDNRGFAAAISTGIAAAGGELIGILDADDEWPADRLAGQVPLLRSRPELGLVHGDMEIVDAEGRTLHPSFFAYSGFSVARGRALGGLLRQNFVAGGATLVRTDLREHFHPIPPEIPYPDWYIAARVAERAEIDHVDACVNRYRMHGANMGLGGTGRKFFSDMRNNVRVQRWLLGHLDTSGVTLGELAAACETMIANATRAGLELGRRPAEILPVAAGEAGAAARESHLAEAAWDRAELESAGRSWARALAFDPWNGAARAGLLAAAELARRAGAGAPAPPVTRRAAVIAFADELVASPELLAAYGRAVGDADPVTLLIGCAPARIDELAAALGDVLTEAGLDGPAAADLLLHPCEEVSDLLAAPVCALYTRRAKPAALTTLPRLDDASLNRLRELLPA